MGGLKIDTTTTTTATAAAAAAAAAPAAAAVIVYTCPKQTPLFCSGLFAGSKSQHDYACMYFFHVYFALCH